MRKISYSPNGKVNLGLFIKGRRPDGYHLIETVYHPIHLCDEIEVEAVPGDVCEIKVEGISLDSAATDNLCFKAWQTLRANHSSIGGAYIRLQKRIPPGSGLGGGSSDAAFTLLALRDLYDPEISLHELTLVAARLGADVPFFLINKTSYAWGTGTEMKPLHLALPFEIRVVMPDVHSSTAEAYRALRFSTIHHAQSLEEVIKLPVTEWKEHLVNDLEAPVFAKYPQLKKIKEDLYEQGAVYASMSGSGSAVFGLFESQ